jgi:hypothetical protein
MVNNSQVRTILPSTSVDKYIAVCTGHELPFITYRKRTSAPPSDNVMSALSQILHNFFQVNIELSMENLNRVCGRYYAYRTSAIPNMIVKSYVELKVPENNVSYVEFTHYHPDRFYDPSVAADGPSLRSAPRQSHGLVFHVGVNLFLIGNTENGQAVDIFALRDPMLTQFFSLSGFNLSTNLDRIIFAARTILIKDNDATKKGICRISTFDFNGKTEGFDVHILQNSPEKFACDNVSRMRMF